MKKMKKFMIMTLTLIIMGSNICMADLLVANNQKFLQGGKIVEKTNRHNYAELTLIKGPDRQYCTIYAYIGYEKSTKYRTEQKTISSLCKNMELYYKEPFIQSKFKGKKYSFWGMIAPSSYVTQVTIDGSFIP